MQQDIVDGHPCAASPLRDAAKLNVRWNRCFDDGSGQVSINMKYPVVKFSLLGLIHVLALAGCANALSSVGNPPRFQSISIGNSGRGVIDGVSIQYGKYQLIGGPARARYLPKPGIYGSSSLTAPIPDHTEVYWVTEDGKAHQVAVPTVRLVPDLQAFYGFRFTFKDDALEVEVQEKIPTPGPYLNVKYTKVYP